MKRRLQQEAERTEYPDPYYDKLAFHPPELIFTEPIRGTTLPHDLSPGRRRKRDRQLQFLAALSAGGSIGQAAAFAGVTSQAARKGWQQDSIFRGLMELGCQEQDDRTYIAFQELFRGNRRPLESYRTRLDTLDRAAAAARRRRRP